MSNMLRILAIAIIILFGRSLSAQDISNAYTVLPDGGAIGHTVSTRLQDATMATDFCTPSDMNSNATTCLQNAIHAVCTRTGRLGGILYLPAGSYAVPGTLNVECQGMTIVGAGQGDRTSPGGYGTLINATGTSSNPVISANLGSTYGLGFSLRDLMIYNSSGTRAGAFLDIKHWANVLVNNVQFYQPCSAIRVSGGNTILIQNSRVDLASAGCDAIYLTGNVSAAYQQLDTVQFSHMAVSTNSGGELL